MQRSETLVGGIGLPSIRVDGSTARPLRILIVTDAWAPQVNGVVVTLTHTIAGLRQQGHEVELITPEGFRTVPLPSYPDIPLSLFPRRKVARRIEAFEPDAVHIATEGPLGLAARSHCVRTQRLFTTAYHTQFPEYVHARCRLPVGLTYAWLRRFHGPAAAVMCPTPAIVDRLRARGFTNVVHWSRGVDTALFRPPAERTAQDARPIFACVGRVAIEKNIEAFLRLDLPGTKWVIGEGPARPALERTFPDVLFSGVKPRRELVRYYQEADVFVFPSRTDTFGLVMIEAMACGTPVAAFPVPGPLDVVTDPAAGVLSEDLRSAALAALALDRAAVRRFALNFSWDTATSQFLNNLTPADARA